MYPSILRSLRIISFASHLLACGSSPDSENIRQSGVKVADAISARSVTMLFSFPDRADLAGDQSVLQSDLNAFYYSFIASGENCGSQDSHTLAGAYEDSSLHSIALNPACDYAATIKLGSSNALSLASNSVAYNQDIKQVIASACVSCHAEYSNDEAFKADKALAILSIENGTMPPNAPLDDATVAKFLAWADGGFNDDREATEGPGDGTGLTEIYYRNNFEDTLSSAELSTRSLFELQRSLWIQPAAIEKGLSETQIRIYGNKRKTQEKPE